MLSFLLTCITGLSSGRTPLGCDVDAESASFCSDAVSDTLLVAVADIDCVVEFLFALLFVLFLDAVEVVPMADIRDEWVAVVALVFVVDSLA